MDEVGVYLQQPGNGRTWTFPEERQSGRISVKGSKPSRQATALMTTCADRSLKVPLGMIFKGQGTGLSMVPKPQLAKKKVSSGVHYMFQGKAWMDLERLMLWFSECFVPHRDAAHGSDVWVVLFLDACGKTFCHNEFKDFVAKN